MLALAASLCAPAQTAPQKIGVINMQEALVSTNDGKKAVTDLRAKYGPKDQDFQRRGQAIQAKQEQYRKSQNTMSEEAKASAEREIDSLSKALQRDSDDVKQDMEQDQQRMVQELGGKIMQVITKYATDNHYTAVFDVSGQPNNILFASNTVDITRDIIAMYDKAAPVTPSAPPAAKAPAPSASAPRTAAPRAPGASKP
ncbi:MAG TPA: OmpH family outer membrane protein [Bryobacteraceae bacterium]|nr:OmpH family outer membrane protein [Bryobacteraceae bacterium]